MVGRPPTNHFFTVQLVHDNYPVSVCNMRLRNHYSSVAQGESLLHLVTSGSLAHVENVPSSQENIF